MYITYTYTFKYIYRDETSKVEVCDRQTLSRRYGVSFSKIC